MKMKQGNGSERDRVSGLIGMLSLTETEVAKAWLSGNDPAKALANVRGKDKPGREEHRDVRDAMASERVRQTIAGVTRGGGVRGSDLRAFVLERLVTESLDAREGATRVKSLELIGNLPGVDAWKPQDDRDQSLADAGIALSEALAAVGDRLSSEVIDINSVHGEPSPTERIKPPFPADDGD